MLIDELMPVYDVSEFHETVAYASPSEIFEAIHQVNLARSPPIMALFAVRAVPHFLKGKLPPSRKLTIDYLLENGFVMLKESEAQEIVLGAVGRFWRPDSGIETIDATEFVDFNRRGFAKAALNFAVHPRPDGSNLITTETRVQCTDRSARQKFLWYWKLVGPFSGLIRVRMLRMIKEAAERGGFGGSSSSPLHRLRRARGCDPPEIRRGSIITR